MKILLVVATAARTGVESVILMLAESLTAQDVAVQVVTFTDGPLVESLWQNQIPVDIVPVRGKTDLGAILRLRRYIKQGRFDLVHTHGQRAMFMGNIAARLAGIQHIVTTFHEFTYSKAADNRLYRLYVLIENLLARTCTHHFVTCSDAVRTEALTKRNLSPEKVTRIYNGVDLSRFHPNADADQISTFKRSLGIADSDVLLGTVARLIEIKGQRYAIQALPEIKKAIPSAKLLLAGSGPDQAALQALSRECGVEKDVLFLGEMSDMNLVYNSLDVIVHPALSEPLGIVILEAMACNVPIVAAAAGGLPEILTFSPNNIAVAPRDSQAIAEGVIRLLNSPTQVDYSPLRRQLEANFSSEVFARQHLELYKRLLSSG